MKRDLRHKFVVGNWKMHTTAAEARRLAKAIVDGIGIDGMSVSDDDAYPS
jgi:triosephosphate isomerase